MSTVRIVVRRLGGYTSWGVYWWPHDPLSAHVVFGATMEDAVRDATPFMRSTPPRHRPGGSYA